MTGQQRVNVRYGFRDQDVWREALGGAEPLFVFSIDGPLDAPDQMGAGGMRATNYGPHNIVSFRQEY
jgi:hypothetical protein